MIAGGPLEALGLGFTVLQFHYPQQDFKKKIQRMKSGYTLLILIFAAQCCGRDANVYSDWVMCLFLDHG